MSNACSVVDLPLLLTPVSRFRRLNGTTVSAPKHLKFSSRSSVSTANPQALTDKAEALLDRNHVAGRPAHRHVVV